MRTHLLRTTLAATLGLFCVHAKATLGQRPLAHVPAQANGAHPQSFAAAMSGRTTSGAPYTSQEALLADGVRITEFTNGDGVVFALKWEGPVMPDLQALLGDHKASLDSAQQQQQRQGVRSPRRFDADWGDWVIHSSGHLRAYKGYSFLRSMLPDGFDEGVLQ